jgi:superfamily II DNA or RNA helicase
VPVLAAPRLLDDGVDVPTADLAVIVGASRSRRQMIQRMGRVLRRKPAGRWARFAVVFVEGTVEDPDAGAHEAFLDEIVDVADEISVFDSRTAAECPDLVAGSLRCSA